MNEWERYYCPFCVKRGKSPDTKGKLYVNWQSHFYLCFRCNKKGHTYELREIALTKFNGSLALSPHTVDIWDPRRFVTYSLEEVKEQFFDVYSFLSRKNALEKFKIVSLVFFSYGYGLVLPLDDDYYQIRIFSDLPDAPKYLTKRGFKKKDSLIGVDTLKTDLVIIVEGVFDYYRLEGFAVTVLGRFISDTVMNRLISRGQQKFIVLWDEDSHINSLEDAVKIYNKFSVDTYAGFCLEGSPSDDSNLGDTPCLRISNGKYFRLKDLLRR